jgi:hypothetical protein
MKPPERLKKRRATQEAAGGDLGDPVERKRARTASGPATEGGSLASAGSTAGGWNCEGSAARSEPKKQKAQ